VLRELREPLAILDLLVQPERQARQERQVTQDRQVQQV
jgi:hypothetical protein